MSETSHCSNICTNSTLSIQKDLLKVTHNNFSISISEKNKSLRKFDSNENLLNGKRQKPINNTSKNNLNIESFNENLCNLKNICEIVRENFSNFIVFTSIYDLLYLIYATKKNSIVSYNIIENQIFITIYNAHENIISSFKHYCQRKQKLELFISTSFFDLKIWNIENYSCIFYLNNSYTACFFTIKNINYIAATSINKNSYNIEKINIFNLESGDKVKSLDNSQDFISFIDSYTENENLFIIIHNRNIIKSFDYEKNKIYNNYFSKKDDENNENSENNSYFGGIFVIQSEGMTKLIVLCDEDNQMKIWNFHNGNLMKIINFYNLNYCSVTLWNENYLFLAARDGLKLINIKEEKIITINKKREYFNVVKKIMHPKYGECLITKGRHNENIKIWVIEKKDC